MPPDRMPTSDRRPPGPSPAPAGRRQARRFPPTSRSPREARAFAAEVLGGPGSGMALDEEVVDEVVLVVSELAANAVRHAATPFELVVDGDGDRVRVEVRDGSHRMPRRHVPALGDATGRGLLIVGRLAIAWGADRTVEGKVVWAELPGAPAGSRTAASGVRPHRRRDGAPPSPSPAPSTGADPGGTPR